MRKIDNTIFIPLGCDCGTPYMLKELGVRRFALPFDWIIVLDNIVDTFTTNFQSFWTNYTFELHGAPPQYRVDRLKSILENFDGKVIFFRRSHFTVHHDQYPDREDISDEHEISQMKNLTTVLKQNYPNLDFEILLFLTCDICKYPKSEEYDNLKVISISEMIQNYPAYSETLWTGAPYCHQTFNYLKTLIRSLL